MRKGPGRVALVVVAALVVALAGIFVVDRTADAVFGRGLFEAPKPSMSDVLNGRVAGAERLAALGEAEAYARGFQVKDVTRVGGQSMITCSLGQNNWKVHDGYRLRCGAAVTSFLAWSGEYGQVRDAVRAEVAKSCSGPALDVGDDPPSPRVPTTAEEYECGQGRRIVLKFALPRSLLTTDTLVNQGVDSDSSRYISGPSPDELVDSLAPYKWVAYLRIDNVFFEDQP